MPIINQDFPLSAEARKDHLKEILRDSTPISTVKVPGHGSQNVYRIPLQFLSYAQKKYASIIEGIPDRKKCNRKQRRESYTYENAAWYKIYNSKRENPSIQLLHRDYLLCRDSNMACLLFLLLYFILTKLFRSIINFSGSFVLLLTSLIIITNICTHIKMNEQ